MFLDQTKGSPQRAKLPFKIRFRDYSVANFSVLDKLNRREEDRSGKVLSRGGVGQSARRRRWMDVHKQREDARIKTRLEGPHCLVNRRERRHRLPMCANETPEGSMAARQAARGSLPPPLSLPFLLLAGNYERPIKAGGRGTAGAEWNGRLSGRRRLFIERVELSQCGSRTPPHKRLSNRSTVSCLQTPANRIYTARSSLHSLELGRRNWGRIELGGAKKKTPRAGKIGSG